MGLDHLQIGFIIVAAIAALFGFAYLFKKEDELGALREKIGSVGVTLAGYGFVKLPKLCQYVSCDEPIKAIQFVNHEIESFISNPSKYVSDELTQVLGNMAKSPSGLALLQSAVAYVATTSSDSTATSQAAGSTK